MIVITKRMRLWRGVPKTESDLEKFRAQTREALNKPFHFEARPSVQPWQESSTDPLDSLFKPFSKLTLPVVSAVATAPASLRSELTKVNPRRLVLPIGLALLGLAGFLLWELSGTLNSFNGIVSPTTRSVQVKSSPAPAASQPISNVVPPGTQLQPGGPYTGTGGPEPTPTGSTNTVAPSGPTPTNMTTNSAPAPSPVPTCPAGAVCSGTAIDGSSCTASNPCQIVYATSPLVTAASLIQSGSTATGQPCSLTNPCVLTH